MWSKQKVVAAITGLAMLALPATALAHGRHGDHDWDNWHRAPAWTSHRDHGWHRGWWKHHDDDDWKHEHHYQYHYRRPIEARPFYAPPGLYNGYGNSSQLSYLLQRRDAAWANYRAARARGDKGAEHRLGRTIQSLSNQIRRDNGGRNLKSTYGYLPPANYSYNRFYSPPYYAQGYSPLGATLGQFLGW
jgi:hypothetical protein